MANFHLQLKEKIELWIQVMANFHLRLKRKLIFEFAGVNFCNHFEYFKPRLWNQMIPYHTPY